MRTLASLPISIIDIPEPKQFNAKFFYNFFTKDELINDSGDVANVVAQKVGESITTQFFDDIDVKTRVPRMIQFSLIPTKITPPTNAARPSELGTLFDKISILDNLDKIINEEEFSNANFMGLDFQDTAIDGRLYYLASGSITSRVNGVPLKGNKPKSQVSTFTFSQAAKYLNSVTPETVNGILTNTILAQTDAKSATFVDESRRKILNETFEQLKKVNVRVQLNNKHIHKMLAHVVHETNSIYADELAPLLSDTKAIEDMAIASSSPNTISIQEYESKLQFIDIESNTTGIPQLLSAKIIGYIIDKLEHPSIPGSPAIQHPPIIVENDRGTAAVDFAVKYGATYSYSIRSIAAVQFSASPGDGSNQLYTITSLVASRPSSRRTINCVENIPPPPPADFNITWDYGQRKPRLTWTLPVTSQRDVKKIQIFRRSNINEPFQLIKMYDFNDASPVLPNIETPDPRLIEVSEQPVMMFIDKTYDTTKTFIYALCAIDAHGLSSKYSIQYEISFDRLKNKVNKKIVSPSGAPKSYPNIYLNQDVFIDAIRDSGHNKLKIAFNPEVVALSSNGSDLQFISTDKNGGTYKLQLINVDYQKQETIDISIRDLRK